MNLNLSVILNALGMGMAVAAVVLLLFDAITQQDALTLLGIGLFCVATDALRRNRPVDVASPAGAKNKKASGRRRSR